MNHSDTHCSHGHPYGTDCLECAREIEASMRRIEWEPGTLGTREMDRILTDVLADIWRDCYRRVRAREFQKKEFRERLIMAVRAATGEEGLV